jgi:hypothetical protein
MVPGSSMTSLHSWLSKLGPERGLESSRRPRSGGSSSRSAGLPKRCSRPASLRTSPADLGQTSAVLDERKDDLDPIKETVGSSFGRLLPLLDVRLASADDLNLFSPVLEGLRDGLSQPSPVLDELREDVEESSDHLKES